MSETWLKLFWDLFIHSAIWRPFLYYTLVVKGSILFLASSVSHKGVHCIIGCLCIHLKFLFYLLVHLVHQQYKHLFPALCQHVRHHVLEVPLFLLQLQNNVLLHICTQLCLQIVKQMVEEFMSWGCHCCGFLSAVLILCICTCRKMPKVEATMLRQSAAQYQCWKAIRSSLLHYVPCNIQICKALWSPASALSIFIQL